MKIKPRVLGSWTSLMGVIFLLDVQLSVSNPDWLQSCGVCHCYWNSGKKTADCKSLSLSELPAEVSSEMQVIDLSNNHIAELKRDEFLEANLLSLHKLFMRNCTIQEVNRDALNGLDLLIELDMSHNHIRDLEPGIFTGPKRIRNIIMNNNEIEVLDDYLFENLPLLSRVEFKFNKLKRIGTNTFGFLPKLVAVFLESNRLTVIQKETFLQTPKLLHLSLSQNPWNCSCDLKDFRDFALKNRLYTAPTNCHDPQHLRGKLWSEVPSESFACRPRILGPSKTFLEVQTNNITLPCRIQGFPVPNITWIFNNREINIKDEHIQIFNFRNLNNVDSSYASTFTSELRIYGVRPNDKGIYVCIAINRGGRAETEFQLLVNDEKFGTVYESDENNTESPTEYSQSNVFIVICLIVTTFLLLLFVVVLIAFWYCKRLHTYRKDSAKQTANSVLIKARAPHNSMLEGSVIMEMQKSLLADVNPVEKPPRRSDLDDTAELPFDVKTTLLFDANSGIPNHKDEETSSFSLPNKIFSRGFGKDYVDDNYGTSLPPDLLAFSANVANNTPSLPSPHSNKPGSLPYGMHSPVLASSVNSKMYQPMHERKVLGAASSNRFMTLQHTKTRNLSNIVADNSHQCSPFVPAPVIYTPISSAISIKNGYMTIPRKPRIPSWTPSVTQSALLREFQTTTSPICSKQSTTSTLESHLEPVYDNLGLRTTIGGNSMLNLQKIQRVEPPIHYTMRDRPLPATPSLTSVASNATLINSLQHKIDDYLAVAPKSLPASNHATSNANIKIYEPIQESFRTNFDTRPRYETENLNNISIATTNELQTDSCTQTPKSAKVPPRPPPKPKKNASVTSATTSRSSTSQFFDDEGEDGTEV